MPAGRWAVGVSGGADSVALLHLLRSRSDLDLHLVHLNHETRGVDSDNDASFVANLAERLSIPCTVQRRSAIAFVGSTNPSMRYRQCRHALFREVIARHRLQGVLLAHHAMDQAETILQRLLRGSGLDGLCGMSGDAIVSGLHVYRPLLSVRPQSLRDFLVQIGEPWREDGSNDSMAYQRNRVRRWLLETPKLIQPLIDLGVSARRLKEWKQSAAPRLPIAFAMKTLGQLPPILARRCVADWLDTVCDQHPDAATPAVIESVIDMASDGSAPAARMVVGGRTVRRKRGIISMTEASSPESPLPAFEVGASTPAPPRSD